MREHDRVRVQLETRLGKILGRIDRIETDLRRTPDRDWTEQAVIGENDEVLEGLDTMERAEALAIRTALRRIQSGEYGICARCGGAIDGKRLDALPTTDRCIDCVDRAAAPPAAAK